MDVLRSQRDHAQQFPGDILEGAAPICHLHITQWGAGRLGGEAGKIDGDLPLHQCPVHVQPYAGALVKGAEWILAVEKGACPAVPEIII